MNQTFLFLRYFRHSPAPACRGSNPPLGVGVAQQASARPGQRRRKIILKNIKKTLDSQENA